MLKSSWSSFKILFRNVSLCKVSAWFFFPLKGVSARLIKVAPACAVMISTYEYSKSFFRQYNMEKATSATVTKMFWFRGSSEVNTEVNTRRYLRQCSAIVLLAESVEMEQVDIFDIATWFQHGKKGPVLSIRWWNGLT